MSASPHSFPKLTRSPDVPNDVLGELLHSLSQPLTSLRCSLELSLDLALDEGAEQRQERVAGALQQTENVIGMIQLMREYLDAEQPGPGVRSTPLAPAMRNVIEELSSIAAVRSVRLLLVGTSTAKLCAAESQLRLALQYLVAPMVEAQPVGGRVMLSLGEDTAGTLLRGEGEREFCNPSGTTSTLRRMRLAIARRVLEAAGASLVFGSGDVDPTGFVLRIPRSVVAPV